MGKWQR